MPNDPRSLWASITAAGPPAGRLHSTSTVVNLAELGQASSFGGRLEELRGRSVVLLAKSQLAAALP